MIERLILGLLNLAFLMKWSFESFIFRKKAKRVIRKAKKFK